MMLVALLQLNTNLSPFPTPLSNAQLVTSGVFKISRHPIYTGILIFMFSISLWLGDGYKLSISLLTLTVFYFKSSYEESLLEATFKDYKIYKRKTGRFLPKFQLLK
jgi:protein-S-isoprenylcysteine O-methyltransferase Ste14